MILHRSLWSVLSIFDAITVRSQVSPQRMATGKITRAPRTKKVKANTKRVKR